MNNPFIFAPGNITVHMVGIGGISMSGLAEILMHRGIKVTGSDLHESDMTNKLKTWVRLSSRPMMPQTYRGRIWWSIRLPFHRTTPSLLKPETREFL